MAADLNSDWNPYTSGPTFYSAPDGTTFDNQAALNAYMNGRLGMNRFAGGGGQGGGGGAPQGGGNPYSGLASSYAGAYNSAKGANESRYNDIMGGFDALLGGGGRQKKSTGNWKTMQPASNRRQSYKDSGSPLGYFEWLRLMQGGERQALKSGGQFGSMDASGLYPRMWGEGEFLGSPSQGGGSGANNMQRPTMPPLVYPTYNAPVRGNQNY